MRIGVAYQAVGDERAEKADDGTLPSLRFNERLNALHQTLVRGLVFLERGLAH